MWDFFPPFFPVLFHSGFRLLPANTQCLKLPFRPQGEMLQPHSEQCCAVPLQRGVDVGWLLVMPLAGGDTTRLALTEGKRMSVYLGLLEIILVPN